MSKDSAPRIPNLAAALLAVSFAFAGGASAQTVPTEEAAKSGLPSKAYSPYANRSFPAKPLWGDSHLHTGLSLDAGVFGN
ncbi:MAG: DUF3604 domain-containing protein, partial [Hyphomicrobiales bacterium]